MDMRDLPSVDALAAELGADSELPSAVVLGVARSCIEQARTTLAAGGTANAVDSARIRLNEIETARPKTVINGTGVLLHTNLGRAPISEGSAHAATAISMRPSNVEINVATGRRSGRHDYLSALLPVVTGAETGFAVNNNAGALLLALATAAGTGGSIAVSRGELIEIGGSFRLPSLMEASGARLVEVGTTNRTRLSDYEDVVSDVDAILKVHPSNYRIDGFAEEASYADLADLATKNGIPFIADIGSGLMDEKAPWLGGNNRAWLRSEPGVIQTVSTGADLVLFSGDKLLGGPQAGVIVGRSEWVQRAAKHPIARAVRLDGQSIAALTDVFEMYASAEVLQIPFWRMANATVEELTDRADAIVAGLGPHLSVVDSEAMPGAGSVPGETIPSVAIRIDGNADAVWGRLAASTPPLIGTRREGTVSIDVRSIDPSDDAVVRAALAAAVS